MRIIGQTICDILKNPNDANLKLKAEEIVADLTKKFPIYQEFE